MFSSTSTLESSCSVSVSCHFLSPAPGHHPSRRRTPLFLWLHPTFRLAASVPCRQPSYKLRLSSPAGARSRTSRSSSFGPLQGSVNPPPTCCCWCSSFPPPLPQLNVLRKNPAFSNHLLRWANNKTLFLSCSSSIPASSLTVTFSRCNSTAHPRRRPTSQIHCWRKKPPNSDRGSIVTVNTLWPPRHLHRYSMPLPSINAPLIIFGSPQPRSHGCHARRTFTHTAAVAIYSSPATNSLHLSSEQSSYNKTPLSPSPDSLSKIWPSTAAGNEDFEEGSCGFIK